MPLRWRLAESEACQTPLSHLRASSAIIRRHQESSSGRSLGLLLIRALCGSWFRQSHRGELCDLMGIQRVREELKIANLTETLRDAQPKDPPEGQSSNYRNSAYAVPWPAQPRIALDGCIGYMQMYVCACVCVCLCACERMCLGV